MLMFDTKISGQHPCLQGKTHSTLKVSIIILIIELD